MAKKLTKIAVDLTPILPGGENGGAKIFTLELIHRLSVLNPHTHFILLIQSVTYNELKYVESNNISCKVIDKLNPDKIIKPGLQKIYFRLVSIFPMKIRSIANNIGYKFVSKIQRKNSSTSLRELNVDLFFCPFTAPTYHENGIPTVCTIYDLQYKTYPEFFSKEEILSRDYAFIEACKKATALSAISDYSRDSAIKHGQLDSKKIKTIHLRMANRFNDIEGRDCKILKKLDLDRGKYLVYPANFWKHKNHEMLLVSFGIALKKGLSREIKLVCTGSPSQRQKYLKRAAKEMGLSQHVIFPGYISIKELSSLIYNCRGMIFPSLYEGFGLPVIEAMAAGVPVACSNITSLPEVTAGAAILFDPRIPDQIADALKSIVEDKKIREKLIKYGLEHAIKFTDTDRMAIEYWDLFCFAYQNERKSNNITGVYNDGWIGPQLTINTTYSDKENSLVFNFCAPEWSPVSKIKILIKKNGKKISENIKMKRGDKKNLKIKMEKKEDEYAIQFSPTFIPAKSGLNEDKRKLSIMLNNCMIISSNGEKELLFPTK